MARMPLLLRGLVAGDAKIRKLWFLLPRGLSCFATTLDRKLPTSLLARPVLLHVAEQFARAPFRPWESCRTTPKNSHRSRGRTTRRHRCEQIPVARMNLGECPDPSRILLGLGLMAVFRAGARPHRAAEQYGALEGFFRAEGAEDSGAPELGYLRFRGYVCNAARGRIENGELFSGGCHLARF